MAVLRGHGEAIQVLDARTYASAFSLEGLKPPPWMRSALCAQTDPEAWFPEKGGSTREAKDICSRCTVAAECLDYALERQERFGIWGGLSERERRRQKRRAS